MKTLFISDLHLDPKRTDIQDCFDLFIHSCLQDAKNIDALYILGDLFEVWIGDDASIPIYQHTIRQLKQLSAHDIQLFIMHGNRDFLLGSKFETAATCTLIPDPYFIKIKNEKIMLSHGDIFCTDDIEYMQFRKVVRNSDWIKDFLNKPVSQRIAIAQSMREKSQQNGQQELHIMDVNQKLVTTMMLEHGTQALIHGHTHKPAAHHFVLNNKTVQRIVLSDWNPNADALVIQS
ncbi:MAG: UDP-2,3-diacylglucosamine diphosphatase [gamma proteobacterium symbiont of Taylorina sp.]|nr:UDP-2,3-diacylglucosamine diphosphatase [gamma proteobacterium symbiont of Taylorina sp.]